MILVRRAVERQPARGEGRDRAAPVGLQQRLRQRVEGRSHEVAVQAVHRHEQWLARLGLQARDVPRVPDVLARPHRCAAVAHVAQGAQARVERGLDRRARTDPELAQQQQLGILAGEEALRDVAHVRLEVAREVGVVSHERSRPREALARVLPGEELRDERSRPARPSSPAADRWRGRAASSVAVHRREQRVGHRPQVRRLRPQRRQRRGARRAHEVPRIVARVAQQQHVARRGPRPALVRVRQEAPDRLRRCLAVPELRGDLLEGDRTRGEALVGSPRHERLGGREERPRRDQDVIGLVRRRPQRRRLGQSHARTERLRDREVAVARFRPEAQRAARGLVAREPARRRRHVHERRRGREPREARRAALGPRPLEAARRERRLLRVHQAEAVEEYQRRDPRVADVRELQLVRSLAQQRRRARSGSPGTAACPQTAPRPAARRSGTRSGGGRPPRPTRTPPAGRHRAPPSAAKPCPRP